MTSADRTVAFLLRLLGGQINAEACLGNTVVTLRRLKQRNSPSALKEQQQIEQAL